MSDQNDTAKKDPYDHTSSRRAASHMERLVSAGGKRIPIDFSADHLGQLEALKKSGYGSSAADVIRKAITAAYEQHRAK